MLSGMGDQLMVGAVFTAAVMGKPVCEAQSLQLWHVVREHSTSLLWCCSANMYK